MQVVGGELGVARAARELLRGGDRLLALECQLLEVHRHLLGAGCCAGRYRTTSRRYDGALRRSRLAARARAAACAARVRLSSSCSRSTCSTPARLRPSSVVRRWISRSRSRSVLGVEPRPARRPAGADEPLRLVHAQGLRMHADEVGGDRDHVSGRPASAVDPSSRAGAQPRTRRRQVRGSPTICGQPPRLRELDDVEPDVELQQTTVSSACGRRLRAEHLARVSGDLLEALEGFFAFESFLGRSRSRGRADLHARSP